MHYLPPWLFIWVISVCLVLLRNHLALWAPGASITNWAEIHGIQRYKTDEFPSQCLAQFKVQNAVNHTYLKDSAVFQTCFLIYNCRFIPFCVALDYKLAWKYSYYFREFLRELRTPRKCNFRHINPLFSTMGANIQRCCPHVLRSMQHLESPFFTLPLMHLVMSFS